MSRFTDLFQEGVPATSEPIVEPEKVEEVVSEKVVPITKAYRKKKSSK